MKLSKGLWSLVKQIEILRRREQEIGKMLELLSKKSSGFTKPKLILIGGYALRAFAPFSRYTRDCDFALRKKNGWTLDQITNWLSKSTAVESFEKRDDYGFLRCVRVFDKTIKASLDSQDPHGNQFHSKPHSKGQEEQVYSKHPASIEEKVLIAGDIATRLVSLLVPSEEVSPTETLESRTSSHLESH
jgi:hypothetical protein